MTWSEGIAGLLGLIAAAMVVASQHGHGTRTNPKEPPDGEQP